MARRRVDFMGTKLKDGGVEYAGGVAYLVVRDVPWSQGTLQEVVESGPTVLYRGYLIPTHTIVVGERPLVYIQAKWLPMKNMVAHIQEVKANAPPNSKSEYERSRVSVDAGRDSAVGPAERTGVSLGGPVKVGDDYVAGGAKRSDSNSDKTSSSGKPARRRRTK